MSLAFVTESTGGRWIHKARVTWIMFPFDDVIMSNRQTREKACACVERLSMCCELHYPDSQVLGANMGPTWVLSAPDGPHVGPMNLAIWVYIISTMLQHDILDPNATRNQKKKPEAWSC